MLRVWLSNDLSRLTRHLLERLGESPSSPFASEHIVVPNAGLRRYLELEHAQRFGVAANLGFEYPARWIWQQVATLLDISSEDSPFASDVLVWRVMAWLENADRPPNPRLDRYVEHADNLMRYELALRIARQLDQLITYRPDWIQAWTRGKSIYSAWPPFLPAPTQAQRQDEAWLADVWRRVLLDTGGPAEHPLHTALQRLTQQTANPSSHSFNPSNNQAHGISHAAASLHPQLPARVSLFGLTELPPLYLDFFLRLSTLIEVDCYVFSPCREYWFDLISERRRARAEAQGRKLAGESGNGLLAHWGEQTRWLLSSLLAWDEGEIVEDYRDSPSNSLLHDLQKSILEMSNIDPGSLDLRDDDCSIAIHVCHSRFREVEVLHDQLLARFTEDETLTPGDVLVITTGGEETVAAIETVFGGLPLDSPRHIPYRVSGLADGSNGPLTRTLFSLLRLARSRFAASEIMDLLQQPALARRYDLNGEALDLIQGWMRNSGIRWGRDAAHQARLNLSASGRHTFATGLKQLLLGHTLVHESARPFDDCLPTEDIEGQNAWILGRFWQIYQALDRLASQLEQDRDIPSWVSLLHSLLDDFVEPDTNEWPEFQNLTQTFGELERMAVAGDGAYLKLPVETLCKILEQQLAERAPGGIPGGTVTFTGLTSLRQLPYRLICVIGMDHDSFPTQVPRDEFDLLAAFTRSGDRVRRRDDRNAFLDALLSARDALYISYTGRHIRDNSVIPPSVVLAELIDSLRRGLLPSEQLTPEATPVTSQNHLQNDSPSPGRQVDSLITVHPAQPFSKRYFETYDETAKQYADNRATAHLNGLFTYEPLWSPHTEPSAKAAPTTLFTRELNAMDADNQTLALSDLTKFVQHPVRYLLRKRLHADPRLFNQTLSDNEPLDMSKREEHAVKNQLTQLFAEGRPYEEIATVARLLKEIPDGVPGENDAMRLVAEAQDFHQRWESCLAEIGSPLPKLNIDIALNEAHGARRIYGVLDNLYSGGQVIAQCRSESAGLLLESWLRHLALCAAAPNIASGGTWLLNASGQQHFRALEPSSACTRLEELLRLYSQGILQPLHFFPGAALKWASAEDPQRGLKAALDYWRHNSRSNWGESDDAAYQLVWGSEATTLDACLDERFTSLAHQVYGPMLDALNENVNEHQP